MFVQTLCRLSIMIGEHMTKREKELWTWALRYCGGDLRRLELALWKVVKDAKPLRTINTRRTGRTRSALRPYRGGA